MPRVAGLQLGRISTSPLQLSSSSSSLHAYSLRLPRAAVFDAVPPLARPSITVRGCPGSFTRSDRLQTCPIEPLGDWLLLAPMTVVSPSTLSRLVHATFSVPGGLCHMDLTRPLDTVEETEVGTLIQTL